MWRDQLSSQQSSQKMYAATLEARDESIQQGIGLGTQPGLETPIRLPIGRFSYATSRLYVHVHSF